MIIDNYRQFKNLKFSSVPGAPVRNPTPENSKKVTSNNSTTIRRNFLGIAGIIQLDVLYRPVTSIPVTYLRLRH